MNLGIKQRVVLSSMMWCLAGIPSHACYLVQTQGSGQFTTAGYWKESGEIRFLIPNGVIGVAESEILNITRIAKERHRDCAGSTDETAETAEGLDLARSLASGVGMTPEPISAEATTTAAVQKTEAYHLFEKRLAGLELQLRRLGTMSTEELYDLAKLAEALKKSMIAAEEGEALNPLLMKVDAGLEQIESMIRP